MIDYKMLAKDHIQSLTPYQPGKPIEEVERELGIKNSIKLASNENPLGASKLSLASATDALNKMHIYPDGSGYELKATLANFLKVNSDQITLGNGSENVLELIIKAYLSEHNNAVISQYAFLTIPILLQSYGTKTHVVPAKHFGHDIDAMLAAIDNETRVLFLVNPNNPTGTYTNKQQFEKLMQTIRKDIIVVVDEAYSEYIASPDYPHVLDYLKMYPNLIITRTFSKVYGLAGLRLGYAISSNDIADILNRARLPFNVNSIVAKAGIAAIHDQEHVRKSVALNNQGLKQLEAGLQKLNVDYIPSIANFITIKVPDAVQTYQALLRKGVIVRPLHAYNMPNYIRVSIGMETEISRFLEAFSEVVYPSLQGAAL